MADEEALKELEEEVKRLAAELQATETKLHFVYNRLQQLQNKKQSILPRFSKTGAATDHEQFALEHFIGLRLIHVVGIVVLVIGLSIGVKYAIDLELISEWARVGLAYAAGGVLYFLSLQLKKKYAGFSAMLFSGAMASLYFTTYAAFVYYNMMPFAAAFIIMIGLTFFTAYNALNYNRQEIAVLGLVGGYAIPFLISQNNDRADLFFTYISLINVAVVFLSYKRDWKGVGYLSMIISWALFIGWAATRYQPTQQWIGVLFGSLFFLFFLFAALDNKLLRHKTLAYRDMQQLLLNNIAAYIAALILFAPSLSAAQIGTISFTFSLFIGAQAVLFYTLFPTEVYTKKVLALLSLLLFLIFVANKWDGLTVTLLWLLTAVLLFVWGIATKAVWLRMASIILMGFTLLKLVTVDSMRFNTIQKIISYITLGILLLVVSFFYQKMKQKLLEEGKD
jgi:uncharacterized membrane protein